MRMDEIDAELAIATGHVGHPAYVAAARVKWPKALKALKDLTQIVEEAMQRGVLRVEVAGAAAELEIARKRIAELEARIAMYGGEVLQ